MAPLKPTVDLSHVEGVSNVSRARELYKYYQPSTEPPVSDSDTTEGTRDLNISSNVTSSKISSPDTALTVFCQLTAWRLCCQRAMISLIDAETQYFVAESTRTLDLLNNNLHAPGDGLWLGCSSVSKAGRLCERTIAVAATKDHSYPYFFVNDLSKDEQFNTLPFVTGPPFLRRYIGVPLITKRGIPIGSLFVVDDRPGNELSSENLCFLGTMAKTVMRHLELVREVEEHRRGMKMSHGLSSFVEGRDDLLETNAEKNKKEKIKITGNHCSESRSHRVNSKETDIEKGIEIPKNVDTLVNSFKIQGKDENKNVEKDFKKLMPSTENRYATSQIKPDEKPTSVNMSSPLASEKTTTSPESDSEDASIRALFSRAAYLIQTAFELDGGTVFYDARTGSSETMSDRKANLTTCQSRAPSQFGSECSTSEDEPDPVKRRKSESTTPSSLTPLNSNFSNKQCHPNSTDTFCSQSSAKINKHVEILGYSTSINSSIHGDKFPGSHVFRPLRHKTLQSLLRQYPRGKLWAFNADGSDSSSEQNSKSGDENSEHDRKGTPVKVRSNARFFSQHFPGVRQLLFVPLWDAGRGRWFSGCFTWSKDPMRILSKQSELSFLTAFGNCVMAEWARIDTELADQKKSDFIGSISHELRSPLHGILASVEFLEEVLTGWEKQLAETIESCGRTLLDTINHILDFSKINHFESHWRRSKRAKSRADNSMALEQSDLPMLNLFQDVDISVICEEVIDSVYAGHVFQNITAQSFNQVSDTQGKMSDIQQSKTYTESLMGPRKPEDGVIVILDIDPQNYHVITQPGALRRLIMNVLGNSLKYTVHGYVKIRLDCHDIEDHVTTGPHGTEEVVPRSMLTFTVTDTGKGIAPEFLRNKLFIPFAQENILSSGTGLGLSIVRAIVSLLGGQINIESEVGRGTQVKVSIPVLRRMPQNPTFSEDAPKPVTAEYQGIHEAVRNLCSRAAGQKVSLFGFNIRGVDPILLEKSRIMESTITNYLVNWYNMRVVDFEEKADLIITNIASQTAITSLAHQAVKRHGNHPSIIVLYSQSSVLDRIYTIPGTQCQVGYTAKPIGPVKLAKAMIQTLDMVPITLTPESKNQVDKFSSLDTVSDKLSGNSGCNSDLAQEPDISLVKKNPKINVTEPTSDCLLLSSQKPKVQSVHKDAGITVPRQTDTVRLSASPRSQPKVPSILLVDDNKINLCLLGTYLKRRTYPRIDTAVNGLEAVNKFEAFSDGYDIIFMDITMPILDGFGATRQIRRIEKEMSLNSEKNIANNFSDNSQNMKRKPAIIIAFTGRSSTEDQSEAKRCGIDLFMTKPVPFREVGKICDNWIANQT